MSFDLHRVFRGSKVAPVDASFWFLKLLTTAMGEATSDFLVHRFNPELAVIAGGLIFAAVLWAQLRTPRYLTAYYWAAVVMVSIFGTMCADSLHVGLGVPYVVSAAGFAVILAAVFFYWNTVEHTLSIHEITTSRRELFYWAAITTTFALGTAVGDLTATTFGMGYLTSGIVFAILFLLPAVIYWSTRRNGVLLFWTAYVLARPVGASFADYLGVSKSRGGLNWGPGNVALMFAGFFVVGLFVVLVRVRRSTAH